jgi:hypothetical protein
VESFLFNKETTALDKFLRPNVSEMVPVTEDCWAETVCAIMKKNNPARNFLMWLLGWFMGNNNNMKKLSDLLTLLKR